MATDTWYYSAGEGQNGPFTLEQIRGLLRDRTIDRDTYVWSPAMSDWAPLVQTELASLLGGPPPRPAVIASGAAPASSSAPAVGAVGGFLAAVPGGKAGGGFDLGAMEQGDGFPGVMLRAARTCIQGKFFDLQGRAGRPEFWWYQLFAIIVLIAAEIVDAILRKVIGIGLLYFLVALALFLPSLGASVRRLHDTDRSGWWLLISFVPFVGAIVLIVFWCLPGNQGDNRFGPPPQPV